MKTTTLFLLVASLGLVTLFTGCEKEELISPQVEVFTYTLASADVTDPEVIRSKTVLKSKSMSPDSVRNYIYANTRNNTLKALTYTIDYKGVEVANKVPTTEVAGIMKRGYEYILSQGYYKEGTAKYNRINSMIKALTLEEGNPNYEIFTQELIIVK